MIQQTLDKSEYKRTGTYVDWSVHVVSKKDVEEKETGSNKIAGVGKGNARKLRDNGRK